MLSKVVALTILASCCAGTDPAPRAPRARPPASPRVQPTSAPAGGPVYAPHPSIVVYAAPFAEAMVARDRATGAVVRDLGAVLQARGFGDRNRHSFELAAVDAIGIALRRPHLGREPDAMLGIDGATGSVLWEREVPDPHAGGRLVGAARAPGDAPLALVSGIISVATEQGWADEIHALDARTGELRWTTRLAPEGEVRLVAVAPGVLALASRCSWLSQFSCEGITVGLDAATGARRWTVPIPAGSRHVTVASDDDEVALAVDDRVSLFDVRTGAARASFVLPEAPSRVFLTGDDVVVQSAAGLGLVTRTGASRWSQPGDFAVLGVEGQRIVLASERTEEVLDASTGSRVCHRNRGEPLPGAWSDTPPIGAAERAICQWPARPFSATVRGTLRVDGRARRGVGVRVQGQRVITDARGRFSTLLDAPGSVLVEPVWEELERNPRRPCASGAPELLTVDGPGSTVEVSLEATTRPRACPESCSLRDCE